MLLGIFPDHFLVVLRECQILSKNKFPLGCVYVCVTTLSLGERSIIVLFSQPQHTIRVLFMQQIGMCQAFHKVLSTVAVEEIAPN